MTKRNEELRNESVDESLSGRDRQLVDWTSEHYRPEPMSFEQRAAFDRRLRARIETEGAADRSGGWLRPVPALAAALLLALAWLGLPSDPGPGGGSSERLPDAIGSEPIGVEWVLLEEQVLDGEGWTGEVLGSVDMIDALYADDDELLPDEYQVIASVFLGDV